MSKSSRLYLLILFVWVCLITGALFPFEMSIEQSAKHGFWIHTLVIVSTIFISYFWLNGVKDLVYTIFYHFSCKKNYHVPKRHLWAQRTHLAAIPKVALVYCTCNDFNGDSLLKSMQQQYKNAYTVILDDSSEEKYIREVNTFARIHNIQVIRRTNHVGFKAGNLNNFLASQDSDYDYFVILDSDEIIPADFILRSLDYFQLHANIGIVQANHIATRNRNSFMRMFARGVNSHWPAYQMVKAGYGFLSLLGHGAMIKRECYQVAGGFPHMVAEDLCFSIEARKNGYYVAFAPDIICEEEYPVSYLAFKKRHSKWTQGNMEFIKNYTHRIFASHMRWFEKLDIVLFTYNLPLHAFFSLFVVINVIVLPTMHYHISYPIWMLVPTVVFLIAPMLNDIISYFGRITLRSLLVYLVHSVFLFGSMFYISLKASLKSLFGSSTFLVTPKSNTRITFMESLRANKGEVLFGTSLIIIATIIDKSPLPVIMIAVPSFSSVYLAMLANREHHLHPATKRPIEPIAYLSPVTTNLDGTGATDHSSP